MLGFLGNIPDMISLKEPTMNQSFGNIVRKARKDKGYTLRQLAPLIKIDFTYLSKLENDRADHPPSEELVRLMAKTLELDEERLIYLAGRITQSDAKLIEGIAKNYPDEVSVLFRRMKEDPKFTEKLIRRVGRSDQDGQGGNQE
jgi:HTH-type transcriptional regulator, competence development regulator